MPKSVTQPTPEGAGGYRFIAWLTMVGLTIFTIIGLAVTTPSELPRPRAEVKGAILQLEVARSSSAQTRGLSGHESLGQHEAMLFPRLAGGERQCFWMQDMTFPIDIVWLDDNARIVEMREHFTPESYPEVACGPAATSHAFELRAGAATYFSLERGDHVLLTL